MYYLILSISLLAFANCETQNDAASYARYLVENESYGIFSTQMLNDISSFASVEDFATTSNMSGLPIFLLADISETSKNLVEFPFGSFTIYQNNCSEYNYDHMPYDPLACIRFTLVGKFIKNNNDVNVTSQDFLAFAEKHPAATAWINYSGHDFHLWNFVLSKIYYVGGYGNLHYIGQIDPNIYLNAKPVPPV